MPTYMFMFMFMFMVFFCLFVCSGWMGGDWCIYIDCWCMSLDVRLIFCKTYVLIYYLSWVWIRYLFLVRGMLFSLEQYCLHCRSDLKCFQSWFELEKAEKHYPARYDTSFFFAKCQGHVGKQILEEKEMVFLEDFEDPHLVTKSRTLTLHA